MRLALTILLLYPFLLAAQCFGSFEAFAAAGFSGTPGTFSSESIELRPTSIVRAGFGASFGLTERLYIRTGVQLSQYGDEFRADGLRWGTQHDGDGGFDPTLPSGEPGTTPWTRTRHNYFEGLLAMRYDLRRRGRLRPFVEGGLAIGAYGASRSHTADEEADGYARLDNFNAVQTIARLGGGATFVFNEHLGIYAMPVLQKHLSSINDSGLALSRAWQATLEVGVRVYVDPR